MQLTIYIAVLLALRLAIPGEASAQECHPSYEGACVPVGAPDVDCAGGSGNGPYYVRGPIYVVGPDEYELDRDGDGIACEPEKTRRGRQGADGRAGFGYGRPTPTLPAGSHPR